MQNNIPSNLARCGLPSACQDPSPFDGLTQRNLEVRAKEEGSAGRHAMEELINGQETVATDALAGSAAARPPGLRWGR
jgi:hypothetical protein